MNFSSNRPSVTMTCASEVITATLVPGFSGRWCCASTCAERTMSVRRGSSTISLAPLRSRFFSREANTGWPSVGLAPMIMTTSASVDRVEILRAGRGAVGLAEAVAGRRMADARAGVDVVVEEALAHQLLDEIGLLVGAARRGDAADGAAAVLVLDAAEFVGVWVKRLLPRHFAPRIGDLLADHRVEDAVLVGRIAVGEAALDAGMAAIGLAVLVGHHAHEFLALHFGLERAADAAIGAGRDHRMLGPAHLQHRLFAQRVGRAGLHAGAAGHAFRIDEVFRHAGGNAGLEAAAGDRQREGALHLLAGAHAARADDALRGVVGEIGVGLVPGDVVDVQRAVARARHGCGRRRRSGSRSGRPIRRPCRTRCLQGRHPRPSPSDGRKHRAPSRRGGCCSAARSAS